MGDPGGGGRIVTRSHSAAETMELGRAVGDIARPGDVILLGGELGAGKTTFTKGFASALGIAEEVVSPTFVLLRRYEGRVPLVHADMYRLSSLSEVLDLGVDEMVDDGAVAVVEWGDAAAPVLGGGTLRVHLAYCEDDFDRLAVLEAAGPAFSGRMAALAQRLAPWTGPGEAL